MDRETVSQIEETASVASRLEAIEKMVFSRDQSQGEDWEANCKELEAKNRALQTRNDALQRVIERYETNPQIEDQGIVSEENPDDYYQGAIARINAARQEFVAMKVRLNDAEALEQHFRQKFEHQEEAGAPMTAELDRAERELDMSEERGAELERRWLEISQEKMRVDLKLQTLELDIVTVTRSRDEILRQLNATVKEAKRTSAKLEQAEALLNARGEPIPAAPPESESRSAESGQSTGMRDDDAFVQETTEKEKILKEKKDQDLWVTPLSYKEKPANDLNRLIAALREDVKKLKVESDQAIQAASQKNERLKAESDRAIQAARRENERLKTELQVLKAPAGKKKKGK
jgi:DNA repair exonuclease SbcCD ATPase subunit